MAELADAPDLGSGGKPCRFDSCYPHQKIKPQVIPAAIFMCVLQFDANYHTFK